MIATRKRTGTLILVAIFYLLIAPSRECKKQHRSRDIDTDSNALPLDGESPLESGRVYFTNIQDLEHIAYLSLRNFNLTDETLQQSSLLLGLGRQHQKVSGSKESDGDSITSDVIESSKEKLATMLESFILRLRNGRLRRLSLKELASQASSYMEPGRGDITLVASQREEDEDESEEVEGVPNEKLAAERLTRRCLYLVSIYQSDHKQRTALTGAAAAAAARPFQRSPDYEGSSGVERETEGQVDSLSSRNQSDSSLHLNTPRLMHLCRLVVKCQSADELMSLIESDGSWWNSSARANKLDPDDRSASLDQESTWKYRVAGSSSAKSLRDSLSSSLAKLCPLILFQLHHDEGMCSIRRDDRPPTVTVWAFATLFVTIVSFCSLIGLSITPLLGSSSAPSECSGSSDDNADNRASVRATERPETSKAHQHRSCLTLFEGLAVGSLVGSALFSLIPQAFELQEHESNQGFLLKALIIFFGIYLFFCSERIMRIILDTRRKRKKKKHLLNYHRGSNSIPALSTTIDYEQQQQHHHHQHHHQHHQQHYLHQAVLQQFGRPTRPLGDQRLLEQQAQRRLSSISSGRRNNSTTTTTSTSRARQSWVSSSETGKWSQQGLEPASGTEAASCLQQALEDRNMSVRRWRRSAENDQHIEISNGRVSSLADKSQRGVNFSPGVAESQAFSWRRDRERKRLSEKVKDADALGEVRKKQTADQWLTTALSETSISTGKSPPTDPSLQALPAPDEGKLSAAKSNRNRRNKRRKTRQHQLMAANRRLGRRQAQRQLKALMQRDAEVARTAGLRKTRRSLMGQTSSSSSSSERPLSPCSPRCWPRPDRADFISTSSTSSDKLDDTGNNFRSPECSSCGRSLASSTKSDQEFRDDGQEKAAGVQLNLSRQNTRQPGQQVIAGDAHLTARRLKNTSEPSVNHPMRKNKRDISTVAWMIVLGDGLHNFIDGISIGAAFSESILSGVSISVAVICEEFPHELGDFAVLVSSGMTVRQALGYNFLSACTCYLGMAVGIILGDVNDGASYISALAAGVFLYIALVDMMGELSATLEETSRNSIAKTLKLLLLQNVGIFIGISIIFVLSFIDF